MKLDLFNDVSPTPTKPALDPKNFYTGIASQLHIHPDFLQALNKNTSYCGWNPRDPLPDFSECFPNVTHFYCLFTSAKNVEELMEHF